MIEAKITQIKSLKDSLRQRFDPETLIKLYKAIDELYQLYLESKTV